MPILSYYPIYSPCFVSRLEPSGTYIYDGKSFTMVHWNFWFGMLHVVTPLHPPTFQVLQVQ